jgi:hypothetical protein
VEFIELVNGRGLRTCWWAGEAFGFMRLLDQCGGID